MRAKILLLSFVVSSLSSCSVYMASKGSDETDLSVLQPGTPRERVEFALGKPIAASRAETPKNVVSYQYFTGDEPSVPRAVVYGVLDVATLGVAEVVSTPIESLQGDKHIVEIRYDKANHVQEANVFFQAAPMEKPEKMLGVDCPGGCKFGLGSSSDEDEQVPF